MEAELRVCMLLKINDLRDYFGRTLTAQEISEEAVKNQQEGLKKHKFNHGVYTKY